MNVGDTFEMPYLLPIGKDGRKVRRVIQATIKEELPASFRIEYVYEGKTPGGAQVKVEGTLILDKRDTPWERERLEKLCGSCGVRPHVAPVVLIDAGDDLPCASMMMCQDCLEKNEAVLTGDGVYRCFA